VQVARALGQRVPEVWRDPYALTCYTFLHLRQADAIEEWKRMADRLDAASMAVLAHHAPALLNDVKDRVQASASGHLAEAAAAVADARQMQLGQQMVNEIAAIEEALASQSRGWVVVPEAS
jgi:hypothetical protein